MPYRNSVLVTTDTTITTTTEQVLATLSNVATARAGQKIQLFGNALITNGTNTTALTFRWRRGTDITGTVVGESNAVQIATAAGSTEEHAYAVEDSPGEVAGASYVFTVQQTAASANGSCLQCEAWADTGF